jgi:hypothetical protein
VGTSQVSPSHSGSGNLPKNCICVTLSQSWRLSQGPYITEAYRVTEWQGLQEMLRH